MGSDHLLAVHLGPMDILRAVQAALGVLRSALDLGWPLLLVLPLIRPRWFGRVPLGERRFWRHLYYRMLRLERSWGRWWAVPAAVLPGGIGLVSILGDQGDWTLDQRAGTVTVLLLAVAVLQIYGQERNNRDRIKTENKFTDLFAEIREGRKESGETGPALIAEIREGRKESGETGLALIAIVSRITGEQARIQRRQAEIEDGIRRIADGISTLASQVEEESGEDT